MDPMMDAHLKDWAMFTVLVSLTVWVIYIFASALRRRHQMQMQKYMLDKFSTAQDFAVFMQSPAGQKYMMSFSEVATSPRSTILNAVRTGFVLMFAGAGFLAGSNGIAPAVTFRVGCVLLLAGIGFLSAAFVSYFLAKKLGATEKE
jgi:hypothetical protein